MHLAYRDNPVLCLNILLFIVKVLKLLSPVLCVILLNLELCFQVGEKFRSRAMKFPGLISGCTTDWFQPWPKEALVAVAQHFLKSYEIIGSKDVKTSLVKGMGIIHDHVAQLCSDYFQRFV